MMTAHELNTSVCPEDQLLDMWCSCGARGVAATTVSAEHWHEHHVSAVAALHAANQGKEDN